MNPKSFHNAVEESLLAPEAGEQPRTSQYGDPLQNKPPHASASPLKIVIGTLASERLPSPTPDTALPDTPLRALTL